MSWINPAFSKVSLETEPSHGSNLLEDFSTAKSYAMLILKNKVSRVKLGTSRTV